MGGGGFGDEVGAAGFDDDAVAAGAGGEFGVVEPCGQPEPQVQPAGGDVGEFQVGKLAGDGGDEGVAALAKRAAQGGQVP